MNWPDDQRPCAWIRERLEAFVDGDLSPDDTSRAQSHMARCHECAHELEMAQRVARSLRALPTLTCPDHVVEAVHRATRAPKRQWFGTWLSSFRRPALVGAMTVVLLALVTLVGLQWQNPSQVSAEEIARAEVDAKWVFAKVREVSQRATTAVRQDVLRKRVVNPMRRVLLNSIRINIPNSIGEEDHAG